MALDADHPNIVEYEGALGLITGSKADVYAAIARHRQSRAALARFQKVQAWIVAIGAIAGAVAAVALGILVWGLDEIGPLVLAVAAGIILGAILGAVINSVAEPPPLGNPPPVHGIAPEVIRNAPREASASDITRWTQQIWAYQNTVSVLAEAQASVARKDYENYIPPGDRSTWYYHPEDVVRMENELAGQRAAYLDVAAELGFDPR